MWMVTIVVKEVKDPREVTMVMMTAAIITEAKEVQRVVRIIMESTMMT